MTTLTKSIAPMLNPGCEDGLCLLVVEDDDADAYLIFRALTANPAVAKVVHAPDGVEALRMIQTGEVKPDVAFIDLQMPRKNGFDLLTAISDSPEGGFPMVVLTTSASPTDAVRSRLRSAVRVVTKPESVTLLRAALNTAIGAVCPAAMAPPPPRPMPTRPSKPRFMGIDAWGQDQLG